MAIAPSGGLRAAAPKPKPLAGQQGRVVSVSADGRTCVVDIASTQVTAVIPGSIKGVKQGRSVEVRVQGNDRVVSMLLTAVPAQTYTSAGGTQRTVPSGTVYKPAGNIQQVTASQPYTLDRPWPYPDMWGDIGPYSSSDTTTDGINWTRDVLRNAQQNVRTMRDQVESLRVQHNTVVTAISQIVNILNNTVAASNGTAQNAAALEQLRDVTGTLLTDLKEQGITQ